MAFSDDTKHGLTAMAVFFGFVAFIGLVAWISARGNCWHPRDVKVMVPQSYKAVKVENQALVIPIPAHEETITICEDK